MMTGLPSPWIRDFHGSTGVQHHGWRCCPLQGWHRPGWLVRSGSLADTCSLSPISQASIHHFVHPGRQAIFPCGIASLCSAPPVERRRTRSSRAHRTQHNNNSGQSCVNVRVRRQCSYLPTSYCGIWRWEMEHSASCSAISYTVVCSFDEKRQKHNLLHMLPDR